MTEQDWRSVLQSEGFDEIYVWEDKADFEYPEHIHEKLTAHIILAGEMTMNERGVFKTLKAGQRYDIKPGTGHSVKMGKDGCKYLVGEK
jgi:hypothetical protein